jgi:hypothetical protein
MSYYDHDYPTYLDAALDGFETALRDRYQQGVHDAVNNQQPLPTRLVSDDYTDYWDYVAPEVAAHVDTSLNYNGCAYLNWFANGRNGKVQDVTCDGNVGETTDGPYTTGTAELPESIDCRIGELFAAGEEWAYGDRRYIFDVLPPFALQALEPLERARNALVEMAAYFGADPGAGDDPAFTPAFQAQTSVSDEIGTIYTNGDTTTDWQIKWTGLAAESAAKGFFASTLPTLRSHGQLANGLSTLINERASIIHHYRDNSLNLIATATQALAATTETVTDHRPFWKTVQGVGMAMSITEAAAAGAAISLNGWLGEQFIAETKDVSFAGEPGQIANGLYQKVLEMNGTLATAEQAYVDDVAGFRNSLNAVPSTFLELYDFTENKSY